MARSQDRFRWLPAVVIAALAWLVLFPVVSVDAHYHLATGRRILDERGIPERGVGSATFGDRAWHDNEWGFQLLVAAIADWERDASGVWVLTRRGAVSLLLLRALCLAATLALLSAQMARAGVTPLTRSVALALAAFLTFGNLFWAIRPQILSYLALVAIAYLLERDRHGARWAAWCIPAIVALWANVHGAFLVGLALVGGEMVGEGLGGLASRGFARARRLALIVVASLAAACINPHGYRQVLHPFLYVLQPEIHGGNAEWTRPDFLHLPLLVLTLSLLVLAWAAAGRFRPRAFVRAVLFTGLLTTAVRHLPLTALIVVPLLAEAAADAARRGGWRAGLEPTGEHRGSPAVRLGAAVLLVAGIVGLSGAFTRSGARFVTLWPRPEFRAVGAMPETGVRAIAAGGDGGAIFNGYRFGGFLMFRLYPQERVFMDGRNDLYGTFRDSVYNRIRLAGPGWTGAWQAAVESHDVRWVLLDAGDPLIGRLAGDPAWRPAGPRADGIVDGEPGRDAIALWMRPGRAEGMP